MRIASRITTMKCKKCGFNYSSLHAGLCRQCKRFEENFQQEKKEKDMKNKNLLELKKLKNSTLLKELKRRIKDKEIRFNYNGRQIGEEIIKELEQKTFISVYYQDHSKHPYFVRCVKCSSKLMEWKPTIKSE